jgi:uncharacterized delta-60 repeat protein
LATTAVVLAALLAEPAWAQAGRIDPTWSTPLDFNYDQLLPTPDGGLFVVRPVQAWGGTEVGGGAITRLLPSGEVDSAFVTSLTLNRNDYYHAVLQADGRVVLFGSKSESFAPILLRLNGDGTQDDSFNAGAAWAGSTVSPNTVVVNGAGDIFLDGAFQEFQGKPVSKPIRLTPEGTLDPTFATGANPDLVCLAIADAGERRLYAAQMRNDIQPRPYSLVRLNPDGAKDSTFSAVATDDVVHQIHVLGDGQLVIAGFFTQVNGQPSQSIARISAEGTLLATHPLPVNFPSRNSLRGVFGDGGLLLAFQTWLARVHPDGTEDSDWGVLPDGSRPFMRVFAAAVGPEDRVFINYTNDDFNSQSHTHRLTNQDSGGLARPKITQHPKADSVVGLGDRLELTVEASGDGPFIYRWGGENGWLGEESSQPQLAIPAVALRDAGDYYVVVNGPGGTRVSNHAKVGIITPVSGLNFADGKLTGRIETAPGRILSIEFLRVLDGSPWQRQRQLTGNGQPLDVELAVTGDAGFYRIVVY